MLVFAMAAMTAQAQVVLWDGEDASITSRNAYGGFWDRGNPSVVDNPEMDGINKSAKCLKFTMTGDDFGKKHVACPFRDWIQPNLAGNRRLSFMIKKSVNENVLVELSDPTNPGAEGYWQKVAAWYGGSGKWQKVVLDFSTNEGLNDFPGVFAITGQTSSVTEAQDVYIDNIVIEPIPMVGLIPLNNVTDGTLTGAITVSGSYMKGECQNANGDWVKVEYDDFATLKNKVAPGITSIDMRGAIVKEAYNSVGAINPNALIYATAADGDNVVIGGTCATLNLNDGYAFSCPEDFNATTVHVYRSLQAGINTMCLPFYVGQAEISTNCKIATFKSGTTFTYANHAEANVPFLATAVDADKEKLYFENKGVVNTPGALGTTFVGVYIPLGAGKVTGKWGINADGKLQMGGASATISAFHAYLAEVPVSAREITIDDGEVTGIVNVKSLVPAEECVAFDLQGRQVAQPTRGLYIVNGKKIVVK